MTHAPGLTLENGEAAELDSVPDLSVALFRDFVITSAGAGKRIAALFAHAPAVAPGAPLDLYAVVADEQTASLALARTRVEGGDVRVDDTPNARRCTSSSARSPSSTDVFPRPSLAQTRALPAVVRQPHNQVRHLVRSSASWTTTASKATKCTRSRSVPYMPGIIEPGHFRFQCHGEKVFHLEISLGYQHRGIERALAGGPAPRTVHYMETLAGDTTIGHTTAYCHAVEGLARVHAPAKAQFVRGIALELERIANHVGDLGRSGWRRRLPADGGVLRAPAR